MTAKEKLKLLYIQKDKDYNKYRAFCLECNLVTLEELKEIKYEVDDSNILPFDEWVEHCFKTTEYFYRDLQPFKEHYQNLLPFEENLKLFEEWVAQE